MLSLVSKRPTIEFELDGEVKSVPVTFNRADMAKVGDIDMTNDADAAGWFLEFLRSYMGDIVDELGDDVITAISTEWNAAREALGEATVGEH